MSIAPPMRPRCSRKSVLEIINGHIDLFPGNSARDEVMVVAQRGYYLNTMGKKGSNDRGIFDDAISVISPSVFASFNGNTDPSAQYKKNLATLYAPQVVIYRPGYHGYNSRYGHPAFRQASNVTVERDGWDDTDTDSPGSRFWINLHSGGNTTTSSAGCQTIYKPQWAAFYALVRDQLNEFGQETFPYLLIEA